MPGYEKRTELIDLIYRVFYIILILFVIKLISIQIVNHSYYLTLSEKNRIRTISKLGPRGNIITSDNVAVAVNKPSYSIMYFPRKNITDKYIDDMSLRISKVLSVSYDDIKRSISVSQKTSKPSKIINNLSIKSTMFFYELKNIFPELEIIEENARYYPYGNFLSHIIGYTGKIGEDEIKYYISKNYSLDSLVGKTGVEKKYESNLKGGDGGLFMEVDNRGRLVNIIGFKQWHKGDDVMLTINYKVQKAMEDSLSKLPYKRGAAVCMDATNGKILGYAVKPGFDLNYFSSYRDDKKYEEIDEFNIPISGLYPPASTFKIIMTAAGLESGKISESTQFYCPGYYDAGNRVFKCWEKKGHKMLDLIGGLAKSCDVYYYNVGNLIGPYEIENMARKFRLNEKTGIDLPYEKEGKIFGPRARMSGKGYWFIGDTLNMSIGQGETLVTPMEMLMVMSSIANKGKFYKPYYVDSIVSSDDKVILRNEPQVVSEISLKDETYATLYKALRSVITDGTGKLADVPGVDVYGKTGTAQNPHGKDHAWFVAFAQKDGKNPIAISVLIEHGEHGSTAAVVARDAIKSYFLNDDHSDEIKLNTKKDIIIE
ncbi:MAG: penicillin-binding protein 2 [Elusimicrobiales bacterium]|nr:penicillin-binding protein 2 [Elusimicrobiales bacterium]